MEDYLESIGVLCGADGVARVSDLARRLEVRTSSVVGALRTLKREGFVEQQRYGFIRLTDTGRREADRIQGRHVALALFLEEVLGLDPVAASKDACRVEHVVEPETLRRLSAAAAFLVGSGHPDLRWKEEFRTFYEQWDGEGPCG
jgi:DtxR family Mn-dependent transcriptional regulator